mmetsp:Transcript_20646/g.64946  ORF Transcript_20646/g.64946 Transcript_20646/m.64946 type:complete len:88 (+) Transcript_20646:2128-2391(+)
MRSPPSHQLKITVAVRSQGLGLQLADEGGRVVTRGFRRDSAAQRAGIQVGDVLLEINEVSVGCFQDAITKLKSPNQPSITIKVLRCR